MRNNSVRMQMKKVLARTIGQYLEERRIPFEQLQEIRLRTDRPLIFVYDGKEIICKRIVTKEEVQETIEYVSNYSLYAYEQDLRQGFITMEGGHRVGMTGQVVMEAGVVKTLKYISSINIRIAHEVKHCADQLFPYITSHKKICHTLLISPPGCGKTTLLRDLIRQVSNGNAWVKGCTVGVVDERSEIGSCYMGRPQNDLGIRTDVLDCCPKAEGMLMLVRSMTPEVLAVDEIGSEHELRAIAYAMHCGCRMLATAHGNSLGELQKKPVFQQLLEQKCFERYVFLRPWHTGEVIAEIYNADGVKMYTNRKRPE